MKDLKIFAKTIEPEAQAQIDLLLSQKPFENCKVRIMPDVHSGAGCVIGLTADLGEKVIPNIVGVDFQNFKKYNIPKAQLVIADIPYNLGANAYASSNEWYIDGNNKNGESDKAAKAFFHTDGYFNIAEFFHFCNRLLKKEPKEKGKAPAMIVFCAFQQMETVIKYGEKYGFKHYIPLVFIKNSSAQVLKANMKIVGATEYAIVLYREKLPKFNNDGKMIFNWFFFERDGADVPRIHPTQKPVKLLKTLIKIFTDEYDVVIDPTAGSGSTLRAAKELKRHSYGFEIMKDMCEKANLEMLNYNDDIQFNFFNQEYAQKTFGMI